MPSAGAAATCRRNSSPIAGCVIASRSCFASSVRERPLGEARPGRATRPAAGSRRPNRSTSCASAGVPGSTTCRAMRSASTTTAPRSVSNCGDGRLPRPDPAGQPHHQHAAEPSDAAPQPASGASARLEPAIGVVRRGSVVRHVQTSRWSQLLSQPPRAQTQGVTGVRSVREHFPSIKEGSRAPVRPKQLSGLGARAARARRRLDQLTHDSTWTTARDPIIGCGRGDAYSRLVRRATRTRQLPQTYEQLVLACGVRRRHRRVRVARNRRAARGNSRSRDRHCSRSRHRSNDGPIVRGVRDASERSVDARRHR